MKKTLLGIVVALSLTLGMNGCQYNKGASSEAANSGTVTPTSSAQAGLVKRSDPVTLKVMLFGDKPAGMDEVLENFELITKDSLNTKLNIEWSPSREHFQNVKLKLAAGEKVDLVFDASWGNLNLFAAQGKYAELDKYFNNDAYPGLKKAFSKDLLDSNRINGKIYSIPLLQYHTQVDGIFIRKDLREKYGLPPIKNRDELEAFFQKVLENEKGIVPLAVEGNRGFYNLFWPTLPEGTAIMGVGAAGHWIAVMSPDRKKVLGAVILGDPVNAFSTFPAPLNNPDTLLGYYQNYANWNKYLEKDSISQKDKVGLFASGKAAAVEDDIAQFNAVSTRLKAGVPNGQLEFFAYNSCFQSFAAKCISTNDTASNGLSIPITSDHVEQTMKFLDWIFQNQANHDLFELGVEGVHWNAVGDRGYQPLSNHVFPGYELTWNPTYIRLNAELDEVTKKYYTYLADPSSYYKVPLAGFKFDPSPVKNEIAKVQPSYDEYYQYVKNGLIKNVKEDSQEKNKEWRALGLDNIRQEVVKQLQAYIDAGGN